MYISSWPPVGDIPPLPEIPNFRFEVMQVLVYVDCGNCEDSCHQKNAMDKGRALKVRARRPGFSGMAVMKVVSMARTLQVLLRLITLVPSTIFSTMKSMR